MLGETRVKFRSMGMNEKDGDVTTILHHFNVRKDSRIVEKEWISEINVTSEFNWT